MAPLVKVPANFGRQHIGSLTHSNLTLNLKEGKKSRANSLILSYNSPVIESLVATLETTSLDMQDFQEDSVDCFIDCVYTGEVEKMEKGTFREVNKMGHVFDVSWLVERCVGYFQGLVDTMNSESYEDILFLFEEAAYMFTSLKEHSLLDLVITKIDSRKAKVCFINEYMKNYASFSTNQLDLVIELAGLDVDIVVHSLTGQLTEHLSVHGAVLTENSRHILNNTDLALCRSNDKAVYKSLFDVLQNNESNSLDHLKWVLGLYRKSSEDSDNTKPAVVPVNNELSNLFHCFDRFNDLTFDNLVDILANDIEVTSLLMFAEALWTWMEKKKTDPDSCSSEMLDRIIKAKQKRSWDTVPQQCFNFWWRGNSFFKKWRECDVLCGAGNQEHVIVCHNPSPIIAHHLVTAEKKLIFYLTEHQYDTANCKLEGKCGFILKTTPPTIENPDLFDIKLCTDPSDYPPEIHLHEDAVRAENMHFIMEFSNVNVPVSWSGKPVRRDGDWYWGVFRMWRDRCRIKVLLTK